uniref:Uncharacterized protein n=1 Tax=Picea glauca TaxID=3330 RepID=A0A117NGF3_PICGL|nr:hypothetical protein ABT39_MTgene1322 [Picea glauca]QHR89529.1 hypothetical protein Q903MT_gene3551 [Picea sitchensis]
MQVSSPHRYISLMSHNVPPVSSLLIALSHTPSSIGTVATIPLTSINASIVSPLASSPFTTLASLEPNLVVTPMSYKINAIVNPASQPAELGNVKYTLHGPPSEEDPHIHL